MIPTKDQLTQIAGGKPNASNINSVIVALTSYGAQFGLDKPHRLAHYICQLAHESGNFRYDEEIASGAAYEGRKDLGNTEPGDGKRFKGRGPIQITGRANYAAFTKWCRANIASVAPDFTAAPDQITTDPWEGIAPIWYWSTRKLNALADENNIEQITKKINGGLNGFNDRIAKYVRTGLVLLGYAADDVKGFQTKAGIEVDGDPGPKTRAALHMALAGLSTAPVPVMPSPVVTETEVPVVPRGADKPGMSRWFGGLSFAGLAGFFADIPAELKWALLAVGIVGIVALLFRGEQIAARAKSVIKSFET